MCCWVALCRFFGVHKPYASWRLCLIPERLSVTLCFAWNAPPLPAGMDLFGTHRIKPDFSSIHCKEGSRLFRCCKCEHRPPPPKRNEREKHKHTWAGWTLRASCKGWGFLLHLLPTGMGWDGQAWGTLAGHQEVLGPSLHSSVWAAAAPSHIPNTFLVMAAELPAQLSSPLAEVKEVAGCGLISSHRWATAYSGPVYTWPWSCNCKYSFLKSAGQSSSF